MRVSVKRVAEGRWKVIGGPHVSGPVRAWTRKHLVVFDEEAQSRLRGYTRIFEIVTWHQEHDDYAALELTELCNYMDPQKVEKPSG